MPICTRKNHYGIIIPRYMHNSRGRPVFELYNNNNNNDNKEKSGNEKK